MSDGTKANRTRVYIDGFNFYRSAFKEGPFDEFKWLDLSAYCRAILKTSQIDVVKFFTARVTQAWSFARWERQDRYLRAIKSLGDVQPVFGRHVVYPRFYRVTDPLDHCRPEVEIDKTEEKESDVNLASHMLADAFNDAYDTAVLISDDSDFKEAVRIVREDLHKRVVVIRVRTNKASVFKNLVDAVYEGNRKKIFRDCQLPNPVTLTNGDLIHKPAEWGKA